MTLNLLDCVVMDGETGGNDSARPVEFRNDCAPLAGNFRTTRNSAPTKALVTPSFRMVPFISNPPGWRWQRRGFSSRMLYELAASSASLATKGARLIFQERTAADRAASSSARHVQRGDRPRNLQYPNISSIAVLTNNELRPALTHVRSTELSYLPILPGYRLILVGCITRSPP